MGDEPKVHIPEVLDEDGDVIGGKGWNHAGRYDAASLSAKIGSAFRSAGRELVYRVLCLYYALDNPAMPVGVRTAVYAALGYFILPVDAVPDFVPFVGFSDDLAAVAGALVASAAYVDGEVKAKAERRLMAWFG